jgi:hypothetical protein
MVQILCIHVHKNGKMRLVETIPGMEGSGRMIEGVNSTKIYCKNLYKCHDVLPVQQ